LVGKIHDLRQSLLRFGFEMSGLAEESGKVMEIRFQLPIEDWIRGMMASA
jgi:hypothetical protein